MPILTTYRRQHQQVDRPSNKMLTEMQLTSCMVTLTTSGVKQAEVRFDVTLGNHTPGNRLQKNTGQEVHMRTERDAFEKLTHMGKK